MTCQFGRKFKLNSSGLQKIQSLSQSKELYRILVDQAAVGIFVTDYKYRLVNINSWVSSMFEYTKEELIKKKSIKLIAPESRYKGYDLISKIKEGKTIVEELWCVRKDKSTFLCEITAKILSDGRIHGFVRDITKNRKIELDLKKSVARYQAVVEDQIEFIRRFRPDGTLTFVNSAFCKYYGRSMEELLGHNFMDLFPVEDRDIVHKQISSLNLENPVALAERRFIRPNGEVVWQQWTNRAIFDENGQIIEYQSVGRDITSQKEAEFKIAEAREATKRASRVATLAIIGGGIAHEINQPLNAIKVLAETVLFIYNSGMQVPSEEIVKNVTNISRQVDRIDSIVNHLRSFLKYRQSFEYVPCDINKVVENSLSLVNNQLLSRRIRVTKKLAADLPVCGCSVRFEEVVLNLLMNAVQALEPCKLEEKEIIISTWVKDQKVHLTVSDNGPGIDKKIVEKIFEPFFSTKDASKSMGLGMSIVHSIVISTNGSISIANNPSGGANIHITFPSC